MPKTDAITTKFQVRLPNILYEALFPYMKYHGGQTRVIKIGAQLMLKHLKEGQTVEEIEKFSLK